jgi:hypothetical protein
VAAAKASQTLDGAWWRVDGVCWRVAASNLLQKLMAARESAWMILVVRTLHRSEGRQPSIHDLAVFF